MNILVIDGDASIGKPESQQLNKFKQNPILVDLAYLSYWFYRLKRGGELLAPGEPSTQIYVIDAYDYLKAVNINEIYTIGNVLAVRELLELMRKISSSLATFTWVSDSFLKRNQVGYNQIPLWFPDDDQESQLESIPNLDHNTKTLPTTIEKSFRSYSHDAVEFDRNLYLSEDREHDILIAWHQLSVPYRSDTSLM